MSSVNALTRNFRAIIVAMKLPSLPQVLGGCATVLVLGGCGGTTPLQPAFSADASHTVSSDTYGFHPGGSGSKEFLGCPYPSGDVWQTKITSAKIDPSSAANIKAINDAGGGGAFTTNAPKTYELVNAANNGTPQVPVQAKVRWHTPYSPWPWQSGFYIEPLSDAHALVLQTQNCEYFEGYDVTYSTGSLAMYDGGMWNLNAPFTRPKIGATSTASGIPIGLVAVRPEELKAGVIPHALGWDGVAHSWSQTACVSPAGVSDCTDDITYNGPPSDTPLPYGAHIRLKASFNDSSFPTEAKIVAEALKNYGAYAYDTGCCNTIVFVNDSNGAPVWTSADASALKSINISNFDRVVAP